MKDYIHIDVETWSAVSLPSAGVHAYVDSPDFEILIVAYSLNGSRVKSFCPVIGEVYPMEFTNALMDPLVEKRAHNVAFELACFRAVGFNTDARSWRCSMIKALYCGLPRSLKNLSKVLNLGSAAKDAKGTSYIKMFSIPVRPTKKNNLRRRNYPQHFPTEWSAYVSYCEQDVVAEMAVHEKLSIYDMPAHEWEAWALDQRINDRGVLLDIKLAECALALRDQQKVVLLEEMAAITGEAKPNSPAVLKRWLSTRLGRPVLSINKDSLGELLDGCTDEDILAAMAIRARLAKTSVYKYSAMLSTSCADFHARGFLQFYGASRTGRWAGRRIQPQNLPRNYLPDMEQAIVDVKTLPFAAFVSTYPDLNDTLSQLTRAALVAGDGYTWVVADYAAIEARVLAYLAKEEWRLEVFRTHGKIYEASAAATFGVPFETITKESPLRQQGKTTELALGYQGSVGAMRTMDYNNELDPDDEVVRQIVYDWRAASPNVVKFWRMLEDTTLQAVQNPGITYRCKNGGPLTITVCKDDNALWIKLPSGRRLAYWGAHIAQGKYGPQVRYYGMNDKNQWVPIESYGGKFTENIVQAYARDILSELMLRADKAGHDIRFHVHDEIAVRATVEHAEGTLDALLALMRTPPWWAEDIRGSDFSGDAIPLGAEGFISTFYKK